MALTLIPRQVKYFSAPQIGYVDVSITAISPGRVRYMGTTWPAQFQQPESGNAVQPHERVRVVGQIGITLLVEPDSLHTLRKTVNLAAVPA